MYTWLLCERRHGSVDTEDRCTHGRYVKDATGSVDTEDRCTLGRYVKDAMGV